jgi:Icc-related predicted phosphoesterase
MSTTVRIAAIADTQCHSSKLYFPPEKQVDILIHAGDLTEQGNLAELEAEIAWLASIPNIPYKILIAGNHDIGLDPECNWRPPRRGPYPAGDQREELIEEMRRTGITYLSPENPSTMLQLGDSIIHIYGLPYSPDILHGRGPCAFMRPETEDTWCMASNADILVSHAPPYGILDETHGGMNAGCHHFLRGCEKVKPKAAVFGHIHEARGVEVREWQDGGRTLFVNAANLDFPDEIVRPPTYFEIEVEKDRGAGWRQVELGYRDQRL